MSGTRALFASIGASVSLIAAAALSLLAVSAVFAFGGWSDPVAESVRQSALVLTADAAPKHASSAKPVKLSAPIHRRSGSRSAVSRAKGSAKPRPQAAPALAAGRSPKTHGSVAAVTSPELSLPQSPAAAKPQAPAAKKSPGDGVRTAGDDLSSTVQNAGDALSQVTNDLLPPVTKTVQSVVNLLAALLRRTTNTVGGVVDVLPAK